MASELWEVKNGKIRNLTKEDIDIKTYKSLLVKQSMKDIEKAKLIGKNSQKAKT